MGFTRRCLCHGSSWPGGFAVTGSKIEFLLNQKIIESDERDLLLDLESQRYIRSSKIEENLQEKPGETIEAKRLSIITSAFTEKGIPARLTTFLAALAVAVFSTYLVPPGKK